MSVMLALVLLATAVDAPLPGGGEWQITDAEAAIVSELEGGMFSAKMEKGTFIVVWVRVSPKSAEGQTIAGTEIELSGHSTADGKMTASVHPAIGVGVGTRTEAIGSNRSTCGYLLFDGFVQGKAALADKDPAVGTFRFERVDRTAPVMLKLKGPASLCLAFAVPDIATNPNLLTVKFGATGVQVRLADQTKKR